MSVVATPDLGELGPSETQPILVEWRWYYHVPELVIWILVAILLVLVKENRNWQAWTILIPAILLTTVIWPLVVYLTPRAFHPEFFFTRAEQADFSFNWLIGGWTAVWLMAPWLARCRAAVAFSLVLVFLLLSGTVAHICAFSGARAAFSSTIAWYGYLFPAILWYGTCAVAMLLGMTVAAIRCRNTCRPRRFLVWLAIGILCVTSVGTAGHACPPSWERVSLALLLRFGVVSLGVAAITYSVSLPFLYLAQCCPCYRNRLYNALRLPDSV